MSRNDTSASYYDGMQGELYQAIVLGRVPNHRRFLLLGNNPDIDIASVPEDIWANGGTYPLITTPVTLEVVSSSASDTAAGTGARVVALACLDANYVEVVHMVTLNGITPVSLPSTVVAINVGQVVSAGSGATNAGIITIRDAGAGTTRSLIPIGTSQTRKAVFTVPAGHTLHVTHFLTSLNRSQGNITNYATVGLGTITQAGVRRLPFEYSVSTVVPAIFDVNTGAVVSEKETLFARCIDVSADNSNITVALTGILSKNV